MSVITGFRKFLACRNFFTTGLCLTLASVLTVALSGVLHGQSIRNYNANFTTNTIVADGVVSAGEWDGADAEAGDWRELRNAFTDVDEDNNRFRVLYDDANLYILYETDYDFGWLDSPGGSNPAISFGEENLNLYVDPNRDGDLNQDPDSGLPSDPLAPHSNGVDGYQIAFNQYVGTHISTDTDRDGVGFYTEAHVDTPFGDQADWNEGGSNVDGPGLDGTGITVGQVNTNPSGGVAELIIPFAALDADAQIDDGNGGMKDTGLNAIDGASAGEVWGFNMSMITGDSANNFLPIWNWHAESSFALWPHGTLTFVGAETADVNGDGDVDGADYLEIQSTDPSLIALWQTEYGTGATPVSSAGAVPEPTSAILLLSAALIAVTRKRR